MPCMRERLFETEIRHQRADDAALERLRRR
jgi:hypothetical protein